MIKFCPLLFQSVCCKRTSCVFQGHAYFQMRDRGFLYRLFAGSVFEKRREKHLFPGISAREKVHCMHAVNVFLQSLL